MIKKITIVFFKIFLSIALFIGLQQLIELKTRGFCLQKIQADDLVNQEEWKTPLLSCAEELQIKTLLSQPYYLIGSGSECFAFKSEDGKAVIKFFKLDQMRPVYLNKGIFAEDHSAFAGTLSNHLLIQWTLPNPFQYWLKRFLGIREFRIQRTFNSIKLAYNELKEETGLLYLHLNSTDYLHQILTLCDGNGIRHEIDLDSARFYLQKSVIPFERHLTRLHKENKLNEAKASIDSLLELILIRCKKGFADRDVFPKNFGFINNQAIEIDTGSFHKDSQMQKESAYKKELFYASLELKRWLKKNYPELVSYLETIVSEEICLN